MAQHVKEVAVMAGMVAGLHKVAKDLEGDLPEMDMVACALEDVAGILVGIMTEETHPEGLARYL